jgi:glycosyltransferase involved in cell wall biosynthesis
MDKLPAVLSSKILTIGPDYRNHRGGIGAVISVYSKYYEVFNFIPSYRLGSVFYRSYVFVMSLFKLVMMLISDKKIKIVHIHGASNGSFYRKIIIFFISKFIFRKKVIYHIHGGGYQKFYNRSNKLTKSLIRKLISGSDVVICLSESWYEYYNENFHANKIIVLPNIIDYPVKQQVVKNSDLTIFLFFGLICDAKGIFDLLEVITANKEEYRNKIKLLIGGNGEVQRLQSVISVNKLGDIVEFLGWVDNERKISVLNQIDVFILPSYNEGLPISILEAMSYGKAIISTGVGGIPEIVRKNENGVLIEPGNKEQIAQAITYFLDHRGLVEDFSANSERIAQKYLPSAVLNELVSLYSSLLPDSQNIQKVI